jgi:hypothetical protein
LESLTVVEDEIAKKVEKNCNPKRTEYDEKCSRLEELEREGSETVAVRELEEEINRLENELDCDKEKFRLIFSAEQVQTGTALKIYPSLNELLDDNEAVSDETFDLPTPPISRPSTTDEGTKENEAAKISASNNQSSKNIADLLNNLISRSYLEPIKKVLGEKGIEEGKIIEQKTKLIE